MRIINKSKERLKYLNNLVDNVAKSRYPNVNYEYYNTIANCVLNNMKLHRVMCNNVEKMTKEESIELVSSFYKSIDENFYLKIDNILKEKDENVRLNIAEKSKLPKNFMPSVYTSKEGKQKINLIFDGTLEDAFDLVHELAHTLDLPNENVQNSARIEYSEVTSTCIEKMFLNYLKENNLSSEEFISKQENMQTQRLFSHSLEFAIKYSFFNIKNKTGNINDRDIENIFRTYNIPYERGINILRNNNQDMHFNSKYIIAGIASEQFEKLYNEDKKRSTENFEKYIELIKQNKGEEALDALGVDLNINMEDNRMYDQINIQVELKSLLDKYNKKLGTYSSESIEKVFTILDEKRKKIQLNSQTFLKSEGDSDRETSQIFDLMEKYAQDIKHVFMEQKATITHITDVSPEEMIGGKISRSINRTNNYETERGDWVFASSNPIEGKNPYIVRNSKSGMVLIDKNTYIYGDDNIKIQQDKHGNNVIKLKRPNYVYNISPEKFNPVVTMKKNKEGKPVFEFSEEWVSKQEVNINDSKQVLSVDKIEDITDVIKNYQILCDVNQTGEAMEIRNSHSKEEALSKLFKSIQNGDLRYVNAEANINVSPLYKQKLNEKTRGNYTITPNQIGKKTVNMHIGIKDKIKEIVDKKVHKRTHQQEIKQDSHNYEERY